MFELVFSMTSLSAMPVVSILCKTAYGIPLSHRELNNYSVAILRLLSIFSCQVSYPLPAVYQRMFNPMTHQFCINC